MVAMLLGQAAHGWGFFLWLTPSQQTTWHKKALLVQGFIVVSETVQLREIGVLSPITQGLVDPRIQLVDHYRRMARIAFEGSAQDAVDIGHGTQVSGLDVVADKTVELKAFCRRQMDTLQAADLFDCKIVAQLSSLQGLYKL